LLATGGTPAKALQNDYLRAQSDHSWCVTNISNNVGGAVEMGKCAGAASQFWGAVSLGINDWLIQSQEPPYLCITFVVANGGPDGVHAQMGVCQVYPSASPFQLFYESYAAAGGGIAWPMTERVDNHGNQMVLDNAGGRLQVYNPIDESYACPTCWSESFAGLNY
jgi:hypothetical protein